MSHKALIQRYLDCWQSGAVADFAAILAPDFIDHSHPDWKPGPAGLQANAAAFQRAFSDVRCVVGQMIEEGDRVAFQAEIQATHTGRFGPFAPTDKRVTYGGIEIARIVDGRIVELWGAANLLDWVQQLGAQRQLLAAPPDA